MALTFNSKRIITLLLLNFLSFFTIQHNTLAKAEFKDSLSKFVDNLNIEMENYLKNYLKRNKVGFTINNKLGGNVAILSVPDFIDRETIFSLKIAVDNNQENITLRGNVLTKEQKDLINSLAKKYFPDYKVNSNLSSFPYSEIKDDYAIVNKSYSDLFVKPGSKELASQVLLGTPLKILEISKDKKFARVQSNDDKYISWIPRQNIIETDESKWNSWTNSRNVIVVKDLTSPAKLYFGTILSAPKANYSAKINVNLPNGKTLILNRTDVENLKKMHNEINNLVKTANDFLKFGQMGKTTYLWGGTVGKDLDCSGFNQTVFRTEGIFLPRDADQQQSFSSPVAADLNHIDELKPGDLLFFSEKKEYATHTGIYIGNYKFIHSSSGGKYRGVKISTLKGGDEYDKKLQKMYYGAGRIDFNNTAGLVK